MAMTLAKVQKMFTAYEPMLSAAGRRAQAQAASGDRKILEHMPRPMQLEAGVWQTWFDFSSFTIDQYLIAAGCTEPCQQCINGNGVFRSHNDPLPVVLHKESLSDTLRAKAFRRELLRTDLLFWADPYFEIYTDSLLEYLERNSSFYLNASFKTRGWNISDERMQAVGENIGNLSLSRYNLTLSFHLGLPGLNIFPAILEHGQISQDLIEAYAARNTNIIQTLGSSLEDVWLFFMPPEFEDFNQATLAAFVLALQKAGIVGLEAEVKETVARFLATDYIVSLARPLSHPIIPEQLRLRVFGIRPKGRGSDFYKRLRQAYQGDEACLKLDTSLITDRKMLTTDYPRNALG